MQVRKWLISGEINYNVCRICSLTLLPPGSTHPDSDHAECFGVAFHTINKSYIIIRCTQHVLFILGLAVGSNWGNVEITCADRSCHFIYDSDISLQLVALRKLHRKNEQNCAKLTRKLR